MSEKLSEVDLPIWYKSHVQLTVPHVCARALSRIGFPRLWPVFLVSFDFLYWSFDFSLFNIYQFF